MEAVTINLWTGSSHSFLSFASNPDFTHDDHWIQYYIVKENFMRRGASNYVPYDKRIVENKSTVADTYFSVCITIYVHKQLVDLHNLTTTKRRRHN